MRKLIALVAFALLVPTPAAWAKERNVQLLAAPTAPRAGHAWNATIRVRTDGELSPGRAPTLRIVSAAGRATDVPARATANPGIYRVRAVFPAAGRWRVIVIDGETGRAYAFGRVRVRTA